MAGSSIVWPADFRPEGCPVHVVNTIDIGAPAESIWSNLIDAGSWPDWYANAARVQIEDGSHTLGPDMHFRWRTFGVALDTQVREWVPNARIAWIATALGIRAYHAWLIIPNAAGCTVRTEETQPRFACARREGRCFPTG